MKGHRQKLVALVLAVCTVAAPCGEWTAVVSAAARPEAVVAEQRVHSLGVGAAVRVKLASGQKLKGTIAAIETDGFDLTKHQNAGPRRINFTDVADLKQGQTTYRTSGSPNPDEVRRVVRGLGLGQYVAVTLTSAQKFRGRIRGISDDHFQVQVGGKAGLMEIAYGDVQEIGPAISPAAKVTLIVVGGLVAFLVIVGVSYAAD